MKAWVFASVLVLAFRAYAQDDESDPLLTSVRQPRILENTLPNITVNFKTGPNIFGTEFTIKCVLEGDGCDAPGLGQSVSGYLPVKPAAVEGVVQGLEVNQTYSCFVETFFSEDRKVSYCQEAAPIPLAPVSLLVTSAGNQTAGVAGSVSNCTLTTSGRIHQCSTMFSNSSVIPLSSSTFTLRSQNARAADTSLITLVNYCEGLEGGVNVMKDNGPPVPQPMDDGVVFDSDNIIPPVMVVGSFRGTSNYTGPDILLATLFGGIQGCYFDAESLLLKDCVEILPGSGTLYSMVSVDVSKLRAYLPDTNQTVSLCNVNASNGVFDQCRALEEKFDIPTTIIFRHNQTLAYIVSSNATFDFLNRLPEIKGPGYVTVCEVNALGDFENCKYAVTGLSAPTTISFFEDFAFISQSAADTVTTCKVSKGNGTFYDCEDNATEFTNPSSVEVVAI